MTTDTPRDGEHALLERLEADNAAAAAEAPILAAGGYELEAALFMFDQVRNPDPGSFASSLMETYLRADLENAAKMRQVFPEFTVPLDLARKGEAGREALRRAIRVQRFCGRPLTRLELQRTAEEVEL